jgi:hypothetical protein
MPPKTNTIKVREGKIKAMKVTTAKQPKKKILTFRISLKMKYTAMKHDTVRLCFNYYVYTNNNIIQENIVVHTRHLIFPVTMSRTFAFVKSVM